MVRWSYIPNIFLDYSTFIRIFLANEWPPTNPAEASDLILLESMDDMSFFQETFETDQTGDDTMHSEGSSISHFPTFNFSINALVSLSFILQASRPGTSPSKVTLLLGVLEVDGPNYVTIKTGPHSGSEVGLLKIIVGDERGAVSKIVAWRETADVWGGNADEPALKRGDIVLFENVLVSSAPPAHEERRDSDSKVQITASPHLKSQAHICYRTLPHTYEDKVLRPDLRLGDTVPAVRKVGEVVTWMERMAGIRTNL